MSWTKLLQDGKVHRHQASAQEISEIRGLAGGDLAAIEFG
jgi:hypothetical protein